MIHFSENIMLNENELSDFKCIEKYEIKNNESSFSGRVCIKLNDNFEEYRNHLEKCEKLLKEKYQHLSYFDLEFIVDKIFKYNIENEVYIKNLSYKSKNNKDIYTLGIRPKRSCNDFLKNCIPDNMTLLFIGHLKDKTFIIDEINDIEDREKLDYEVECTIIPTLEMHVHANVLFDVLYNTQSIVEYTTNKLEEWKAYVSWKKEITKAQLKGCKFNEFEFDKSNLSLIFTLSCLNKEQFTTFKKYLKHDLEIFDSSYSSNKDVFVYNENNKTRNNQSIKLGKFIKILEEKESIIDTEKLEDTKEDDENNKTPKKVSRYIAKVSYEFNSEVLEDVLEDKELEAIESSSITNDIIKKIEELVNEYPKDGFLGLSAVGEFSLLRRFEIAIQQLERNESVMSNLNLWLFNIKKARKNKNVLEITEWNNKKIPTNKNQKQAIQKMLNTTDVTLIQGPPGTGKTTVIAEAIYQFVKRGQRVLLTSQSNDAVDNALERLANIPEIRAIRFGLRKNKKNQENGINKFSEDECIKNFYTSLSDKLDKKYFSNWNDSKIKFEEVNKNYRDLKIYNDDLIEIEDEYSSVRQNLKVEMDNYSKLKNSLDEVETKNENIKIKEKQYEILKMNFKNGEEEPFILTDEAKLKWFEGLISIKTKLNGNFNIEPQNISFEELENIEFCQYLQQIFNNIKILKNINLGVNYIVNSELIKVENELSQLQKKLLKVSDEEFEELYKKMRKLRSEKSKLENCNSISLKEYERKILSQEIQKNIVEKKYIEKIRKEIDEEIKLWTDCINNFLNYLENSIEKPISLKEINNKIKISKGKIETLKDDINKIKGKEISIKKDIRNIKSKYEIEDKNNIDSIEYLENLKKNFEIENNINNEFKREWEDSLSEFKNMLNNEKVISYDREYYQDCYINSCNVIGITCTANMKILTEKEFNDFDVVIIDEVSKATPPELLIPLMKAKKAILVGDHRQLPPMFKEHENSYKELLDNIQDYPEKMQQLVTEKNFQRFKNMVTSSLFKEYFEQADSSIKHSLLTQYRMHSDISKITNFFYERKLKNGLTEQEEAKLKCHGLEISGNIGKLIDKTQHAYWIDSSFLPNKKPIYETYTSGRTSAYNILEINLVLETLKRINEEYKRQGYGKDKKKTVGVISFYQRQVNEIRTRFRKLKKKYDFSALEVDINTVDRFQGKEKNIIITSLVRNNSKQRASKHVISFERINVAFSRAQELLIIIGAQTMYKKQSVTISNMEKEGSKKIDIYRNIIDILRSNGCYKESDELIDKELEKEILIEYKKAKAE